MQKNVGSYDRIARFLLALLFLGLSITGTVSPMVGKVLMVIAGVFILTAAFSTCPLYSLLGLNTCKLSGQKQ